MAVATAYNLSGKPQAAFQLLELAAEQNPKDHDILFERGYSLTLMGRHNEGLKSIEEAQRLQPRITAGYCMSMSEARYCVRDYIGALAALDKIIYRHGHLHGGHIGIGTLRFDQHGSIFKIELRPHFFAMSKVVLREFADSLFEHYKVRPTSVADDVCYHDVTCFRGTTSSEQVLILRIAGDTLFHIGHKRSGLTQN